MEERELKNELKIYCYDHVADVGEVPGPWKAIWYNAVPLKAQFFLWIAVLDKISTMNMLQWKGFCLPNISLLCYREAESSSHLLIHCPFPWEVWCGKARDFGVDFVAPPNLKSLLQA